MIGAQGPTPVALHGYVHAAGIDVYYEIHGAGRPLVVIPGSGSTIRITYGNVMSQLAQNRRVIGVETQGEGHTADRRTPPTFERDADDVAAVLDALHVTNADVMGFSNGGNAALELAIRYPRLVRRLILASAFTRRDALPDSFFDRMRDATPADMPPALREEYLRVAPDPAHLPVMVTRLTQRMRNVKDVPEAQIRAITAPTLLLFGDHDVYRPESFVPMFRQFRDAQLMVFPNSLHGQYMGELSTPGPYPNIAPFLEVISTFLGNAT